MRNRVKGHSVLPNDVHAYDVIVNVVRHYEETVAKAIIEVKFDIKNSLCFDRATVC